METQRDHRLGTVISPFFRCPSLGSAVFDLQRIWQEANFLGHFCRWCKGSRSTDLDHRVAMVLNLFYRISVRPNPACSESKAAMGKDENEADSPRSGRQHQS